MNRLTAIFLIVAFCIGCGEEPETPDPVQMYPDVLQEVDGTLCRDKTERKLIEGFYLLDDVEPDIPPQEEEPDWRSYTKDLCWVRADLRWTNTIAWMLEDGWVDMGLNWSPPVCAELRQAQNP